MMMMMMIMEMKKMKIDSKNNWVENDWYKQWLELAKRDYHGKRDGYWICYFDKEKKLQYLYIRY